MQSLGKFVPTNLINKAALLRLLNQLLLDCVPTELIGHVEVASLHHAELTLVTHSPAWASKLRYSAEDIKKLLSAKTGKPIKSITISIDPNAAALPAKRRKRPNLSRQSALQIKALAETIDNPSLKNTLIKLSKHAR